MSAIDQAAADQQAAIVAALELDAFPMRGYRRRSYLAAAFEAGFDVTDLAVAHDVSRKTIYRALNSHSLPAQQPPSTGLARQLYELEPNAVGNTADEHD